MVTVCIWNCETLQFPSTEVVLENVPKPHLKSQMSIELHSSPVMPTKCGVVTDGHRVYEHVASLAGQPIYSFK